MNRQQMIEEIEAKISDKTLSKGCKINKYRDSYRGNEEENLIVVSQDTDNLICFNGTRYRQSSGSEGIIIIHKDAINDDCYNIIGHPISLSRVLSTLGDRYIYKQGSLCAMIVYEKPIEGEKCYFVEIPRKLINDDDSDAMLDDQSEQTIEALHKIFGQKFNF